MGKKYKTWQDREHDRQKVLAQVADLLRIAALEAAVNVVDEPSDGDVPGLDAPYLAPAALEPEVYNDTNKNNDFPEMQLFNRTRLDAQKEAEMGETLTDLTTDFHNEKVKQKETTFGMWSDSYTDENAFEDADMKLGDNHSDEEESFKDTMEFPAVQPPYTNGVGEPNPAYEDVNRDTYNVTLHAEKDAPVQPGKDKTRNEGVGYTANSKAYKNPYAELVWGSNAFLEVSGRQLKAQKILNTSDSIEERGLPIMEDVGSLVDHKPRHDIKFKGLNVRIEYPQWSVKPASDGTEKMMGADYGSIIGYIGADGDELDVYVGPNHDSNHVYVMYKCHANTGEYDEDKVMLGFNSESEAINAFMVGRQPNEYGGHHEMTWKAFVKELSLLEVDDDEGSDKEAVALIDWPTDGKTDNIDAREDLQDLSIPRDQDTEQMKYGHKK